MSKVLITGGAGFIGAHVARALLARGEQVVIIDDFNNRYNPRLKENRVFTLFRDIPTPHIIREDIRNFSAVQAAFAQEKFDHVIHLAAWASVQPSIDNPFIYTEVNIQGTVNVLEAARQASSVQNIVFASSSSVYGGLTELPFKETDQITRPVSPYAATKAAGEILCATWHNLYGLPISCLRFFTVYGPWGRPEMAIFQFTEAIAAGKPVLMRGRATQRDFTYIDDIVQGVIAALDTPHGYAIYNLAAHDPVPLPRLIRAIEQSVGKEAIIQEVPLPPGDIPATFADISLAQAELGYLPRTTIEDGIGKFVDWYQQEYEVSAILA